MCVSFSIDIIRGYMYYIFRSYELSTISFLTALLFRFARVKDSERKTLPRKNVIAQFCNRNASSLNAAAVTVLTFTPLVGSSNLPIHWRALAAVCAQTIHFLNSLVYRMSPQINSTEPA